jgi:tRNA A-37 threonylcarbamoyl transferase component Bud32
MGGDSDGSNRHTPGGGLESADTQHDPSTEIGVARTMESADLDPAGTLKGSASRTGDLAPGTMVGEYRVEGKLGAGGMGVVFAATHPLIGKKAAVKVLKPEMCASAAGVERFVQEARAVNQIGHPNIVDIFSFGTLPDGRSYFVMEWLRGESLQGRLKRQPLTVSESLDVLEAVCAALAAAHDKGIVHRDLKPENVFMVEVKGAAPLVKLLDFGIAKLTGSEDTRMEKTATGHLLGTPLYISPEQARGQAVDARADVYSLGAMAFEMFSGRPPFVAESAMDVVARHLNDPPPKLQSLAPKLPGSLCRLVARMLEKDKVDRPDLAQVRAALAAARKDVASGDEAVAAAGRSKRRIIAAVAGTVVVVVAVCLWWEYGRGEDNRRTGDRQQATGNVQTPAPVAAPVKPPVEAVEPPVDRGPVVDMTVGELVLNVKTAGTRLEVDGKVTKATVMTLPAGKHTVKATARGFKPFTHEMNLAGGRASVVEIELAPVKRSGGGPAVDPDATADPFKKPKPKQP